MAAAPIDVSDPSTQSTTTWFTVRVCPADGYRRSTIAWANSEHLTSVAPSIRRAKS